MDSCWTYNDVIFYVHVSFLLVKAYNTNNSICILTTHLNEFKTSEY